MWILLSYLYGFIKSISFLKLTSPIKINSAPVIQELIYLQGIFAMKEVNAEIISHRPNEPLIQPITVFFTVNVKPEIADKTPINKKFKRFSSAV